MSVQDVIETRVAVTAGIDWASDGHVLCVVDGEGVVVARVAVAHSKAGIARLVGVLVGYRVVGVGIERPDGPVVEALFAAGFTVYVIAPAQIKSLRGRYGSAGNKDDRFDAYVLGDTVRTDRRRLVPLLRDTPGTVALRQLCRARKDLQKHAVAVTNQLRAHLHSALPAVVGLFSDLDSAVSRAFIAEFTSQEAVDRLTMKRLTGWLAKVRYSGRTDPAVLHARLSGAPRGATGEHAVVLAHITHAYLDALAALLAQLSRLEAQIGAQLATHPDKAIFTSLPRAATLRAARLIGEIGDARGRFPTPTSMACLSGAAPSTRESGRARVVTFRWAVDKPFRDAICDFAADTRHVNPWAANLYHQARARGHDHPHAVRILARAWIDIIWKCWTTNTPYDPTRHRALQRLLQQDQQTGG